MSSSEEKSKKRDDREHALAFLEAELRSALPPGSSEKILEIQKRNDGEHGLATLETTLGLTASGDESQRVDSILADVARKIERWEQLTPSELRHEHAAIQALFQIIDRAEMYTFYNPGTLPNCWWGLLVVRLDKSGLYDLLKAQISRETHARLAEGTLKEERSGSARKAAKKNTGPRASRYAGEHGAWRNAAVAELQAHPQRAERLMVTAIIKRTKTKATRGVVLAWWRQHERAIRGKDRPNSWV